ncbi:MAG: VWA domain-containing protein, partial [Phycisphaerales bacterium]
GDVAARGRRAARPRDAATLALRAAALASLALAFAGVAWSGAAPARPHATVVVLDASASMTRIDAGRSIFERARQRGLECLDDDSIRRAGVIVARSRPTALLPELSANLDVLRMRLEAVGPTFEGADLESAASLARSLGSGDSSVRIVVLTDGQGAARLADVVGIEVVNCEIGAWTANTAVTDLVLQRAETGAMRAVATIEHWGDVGAPVRVQFEVNGAPVATASTVAQPGQSAISADLPAEIPAWAIVRAALATSDGAPWDDVRYAVAPADERAPIAIVTDAARSQSITALRAAINPFDAPEAEPNVGAPGALPTSPILAIVDTGAWSNEAIDELARRLRAGAGALWVIDGAASHESHQALLARHAPVDSIGPADRFEESGAWSTRSVDAPWLGLGAGASLLEGIETAARSRVADASPDAVAMRFADGAPALLRTPIGRGALITLHMPVDPRRSTIARTPALPMLIDALQQALAPTPARIVDARIGAPLPIDIGARPFDSAAPLLDSLQRPVTPGPTLIALPLDAPGALLVRSGAAPIGAVTAHVDPAESVPARQTERTPAAATDTAQVAAVSTPLAPWLLACACVFLLAEAALARRQGTLS